MACISSRYAKTHQMTIFPARIHFFVIYKFSRKMFLRWIYTTFCNLLIVWKLFCIIYTSGGFISWKIILQFSNISFPSWTTGLLQSQSCKLTSVKLSLNEFYILACYWEIKVALILFIFNHLNWNPSYLLWILQAHLWHC